MRALTISAHGGVDRIEYREDLPVPELKSPDDVRIKVAAGALNHLDLFVLVGLPAIAITPPWILGADCAGSIEAVGSAVRGLSPGDRVIVNPGISCRRCEYCLEGDHPLCVRYGLLGEHHSGVFAEYVLVPAANVRRIPGTIPMETAAAFTLATLTAWRMVVTRAKVRAGENVLIWGIGGGVALQALQIAKLMGARVWVTSGSDEKLAKARELGADETINHARTDVAREVRSRTEKRGVDVVIDNVGEATWKQSLLALGKRGRLVTCGGTSGPVVETDVRRLFWNQQTIMGSTMGNDEEMDRITGEFTRGRLHPVVDSVFPLERGREAFERLGSGKQFGKVVIRVAAAET